MLSLNMSDARPSQVLMSSAQPKCHRDGWRSDRMGPWCVKRMACAYAPSVPLQEVFKRADADGSGRLGPEEFVTAFKGER
jgi:hypothetical protein